MAKKDFDVEEFKRLVEGLHREQDKIEQMEPADKTSYLEERSKLKELFRDEGVKHFPVILKASTAGTLETLLRETERLIGNTYRIHIVDYGVGPVTEGDMHNALQTGAVIFGFDVPCQHAVVKGAFTEGCCIRLYKVIYKFLEDMENYVHDARRELEMEQEQHHHRHPHHTLCKKPIVIVG